MVVVGVPSVGLVWYDGASGSDHMGVMVGAGLVWVAAGLGAVWPFCAVHVGPAGGRSSEGVDTVVGSGLPGGSGAVLGGEFAASVGSKVVVERRRATELGAGPVDA